MTDCVLAIDPGNRFSGYCIVNIKTYEPLKFGKIENEQLLDDIPMLKQTWNVVAMAIERIMSYGIIAGSTLFDTCIWQGRFLQKGLQYDIPYEWVMRKDEKLMLCGTMKANDSKIRRALIDRFAVFDKKNGKGTKKNPDFFYGFKADMWSAFAIAYTYIRRERKKNNGRNN